MDTMTALKLTSEGAMKAIAAALAGARSAGRPVSVAVVDDGGHLLAFSRTRRGTLTRFPSPSPRHEAPL